METGDINLLIKYSDIASSFIDAGRKNMEETMIYLKGRKHTPGERVSGISLLELKKTKSS